MKTAPRGLGMWIAFLGAAGDPDHIVDRCLKCGISTLYVKSGDTSRNRAWSVVAQRLVKKCRDNGIGIVTWNYSLPGARSWQQQILQIESVVADGVDGHVIDAELEWEVANNSADAQAFVDALKTHFPDFWLAHAPFALPQYHPGFPYKELGQLDAVMTQTYWSERGVPALTMVNEVESAWPKMTNQPQRLAIGVTYGKGSPWGHPPGELTESDLLDFLSYYRGTPVSLYSMEAAMPQTWKVLEGLHDGSIKLPPRPLVVADIQRIVGVTIDGKMGPQTVQAIRDFQRSVGLQPDGVVGPLTTAALRAKL